MPQLPPVAAAVFVFCLLAMIIATAAVVRIRSRRRRTRLAQMVRATAPIPRPAVWTAAQPPKAALAPLRRQSYRAAEREGRFRAFEERPGRDPAAGRPARRLAARMAYATSVVPPPAATGAEAAPSTLAGPARPAPPPRVASHAGLMEAAVDLDGPRARMSDAKPSDAAPASPPHAGEPRADGPLSEGPATEVAAAGPAAAVAAAAFEEAREPESVAPPSARPPVRGPRITVLPPRPAVPGFPALMTREVSLGDAARVIRGALPGVLTMTDGQRLRRAVAIGAATSVVAVAFAIRSRRR